MTWNWKWKTSATAATAVAGWLASPLPAPPAASPTASRTASTEAASNAAVVSDIEAQAQRLGARLAPSEPYTPAGRNLFHFNASRLGVRRHTPVEIAPAVAVAPVRQPFPLRLTGIAVDMVNGVEQRTAIISGPGSLELVTSGQDAAPGYRVIEVGASWADVERVADGVRERLTLSR